MTFDETTVDGATRRLCAEMETVRARMAHLAATRAAAVEAVGDDPVTKARELARHLRELAVGYAKAAELAEAGVAYVEAGLIAPPE